MRPLCLVFIFFLAELFCFFFWISLMKLFTVTSWDIDLSWYTVGIKIILFWYQYWFILIHSCIYWFLICCSWTNSQRMHMVPSAVTKFKFFIFYFFTSIDFFKITMVTLDFLYILLDILNITTPRSIPIHLPTLLFKTLVIMRTKFYVVHVA